MSRTELVKNVLAEVLKGRENELDVQAKGEGNIQVFFCMAYWNEPIQVELVNKLNAQGIALETWNVAGTHFGQVHVRLELMDPTLYSEEHKAEALRNGVDVNIVEITGEGSSLMVTTDEGYKWWGDRNDKLGKARITRDFYRQIKECHAENEALKLCAEFPACFFNEAGKCTAGRKFAKACKDGELDEEDQKKKTGASSCKFPEVRKLAGCEDCPAWSRCTEEKVRY